MTAPNRPTYWLSARFINTLRDERAAGMQQKELCKLVDVEPSYLSRWLHGCAVPASRLQVVKRIAKVLDLPFEDCIIKQEAP
jgi:transcriptional regulator with XRE-family HTH domain